MLADRGPGHVKRSGDLARRELVMGDEPQDGPAARLRDRLQRIVGRLLADSHPAARLVTHGAAQLHSPI